MHVYHLNAQDDEAFLNGEPLTCQITLSKKEVINEGDAIVIRLSNGKTYKGKVTRLNLVPLNGHQFGEMEVKRARQN